MGIIEISDVEAAYGQPVDDEDVIQYYIDIVSAYIETYTRTTFSLVEDEPVICRADRNGVVEFNEVVDVSGVEERQWDSSYSALTVDGYSFDGIDTVYNLSPYSTYRVTISYGYVVPPDDIKGIVASLVLAGSGLDPAAVQGLVKKRVGDREEQYGVTTGESGNTIISLLSIQSDILEDYRGTAWTVRT